MTEDKELEKRIREIDNMFEDEINVESKRSPLNFDKDLHKSVDEIINLTEEDNAEQDQE